MPMSRLPIAFLLIALAVSACAPKSQEAASPSPAPTLTPAPLESASPALNAPVRSAAPALTAAPTPAPVSTAAPSAPKVSAPERVPEVAPRIVDVTLSEQTVHSGDTVVERVETSPNTASVEARIGGYSVSLPKVGVGRFALAYKVPFLPFFLHGKYELVLIARNTAGVQSKRTLPIVLE